MKLRLLVHCLVLALFVSATMLAGLVGPATAGHDRLETMQAAATMDADMPCCPSDQDKAKDCTTNCPALNVCLAKCVAGGQATFAVLVHPVIAQLGRGSDEAVRRSQPPEPPARPPRS